MAIAPTMADEDAKITPHFLGRLNPLNYILDKTPSNSVKDDGEPLRTVVTKSASDIDALKLDLVGHTDGGVSLKLLKSDEKSESVLAQFSLASFDQQFQKLIEEQRARLEALPPKILDRSSLLDEDKDFQDPAAVLALREKLIPEMKQEVENLMNLQNNLATILQKVRESDQDWNYRIADSRNKNELLEFVSDTENSLLDLALDTRVRNEQIIRLDQRTKEATDRIAKGYVDHPVANICFLEVRGDGSTSDPRCEKFYSDQYRELVPPPAQHVTKSKSKQGKK